MSKVEESFGAVNTALVTLKHHLVTKEQELTQAATEISRLKAETQADAEAVSQYYQRVKLFEDQLNQRAAVLDEREKKLEKAKQALAKKAVAKP